MEAGLKKDLRVWRIGPVGSLNVFFFLLFGVISQRLARIRKNGETSTLGERSAMIYFTREVFVQVQDGLTTLGKRIEETSDYFMHAPLGSGGYRSVARAPLLQLGRCDYGLDV
ncbi:hypothetical protein HAX54_034847 [Datura stramonium]|uniref:Uncharacterized protein n=1 Tax=Datura stramonium TaxID=4076 RepID=A0ABS8VEK3_DATST|nr:hypothetical protein [Datura stramonium]